MIKPLIPTNEKERLESLRSLNILDTLPEERFDRITHIAAHFLKVPISQINLIDADRVFIKSSYGLNAKESSRELSFCSHTINENNILEVPDARLDERFSDNPFVVGDPNVKFYAGMPISGPNGMHVGSLCVVDTTYPRTLTEEERNLLKDLAKWAELEINVYQLSKIMDEVKTKQTELESKNQELEKLNKFMVDREMKMIELKEKLKKYELSEPA